MKLSDVAVRQAKLKEKAYKLTDGTGLYVLVNQAGKYWRYDYRFEGKRKTISYGVYPVMTLSAARDAHLAAKRELSEGRDPMAVRKAEKQTGAMTFRVVAEKWFKHWKPGKTEKHAADVWRRLELDILPILGDTPATDLTAAQVRDCIKAIEARGRWILPNASYRSAVKLCGMRWLMILPSVTL